MYNFSPLPCFFHDFLAKIKRCTEVCLVIISFNRFIGFIRVIFGVAQSFAGGAEGGRGGKCTILAIFWHFHVFLPNIK